MKKKIHALALIFPELSAAESDRLKSSIDENGQRDPIVLLGDEIIDGRNRYKVITELGLNPQFRNFDPARDGSPVKFVTDKNLNRRHLTPGQRASVAKRIDDAMKEETAAIVKIEADRENLTEEKPDVRLREVNEDKTGATIEPDGDGSEETSGDDRPFRKREKEAAEAAGASPRALRDFKFVEKFSPKDADLVTSGKITLNEGVQRAKVKKEAGSKFRNEAADLIGSNHDDAFGDMIRNAEILPTDGAIRSFSRLELKEQRKIKTLVAQGKTVAQALKLKNGDFDEKDKVATLIEWFKGHGKEDLDEAGWATFELNGCVIAIGNAPKTDAAE